MIGSQQNRNISVNNVNLIYLFERACLDRKYSESTNCFTKLGNLHIPLSLKVFALRPIFPEVLSAKIPE